MGSPVDPAVRRARAVVGLYGDPSVTWGISLELGFATPPHVPDLPGRLGALVAEYPHLGRTPIVETADPASWTAAAQRVATEPYADHDPLVRLILSTDGRRVVVAAHHGVCDGLGLLAVAEVVTGAGLTTEARGIGDRTSTRPFLLSSAVRLGEALIAPPARFRGTRRSGMPGEWLGQRELEPLRTGTAAVGLAIARVFAARRREGRVRGRRPILSYGASRRAAGTFEPNRATAYFRLPFDPDWSQAEFDWHVARLEPEPVFPETTAGGVGPRLAGLLRGRLGATAIISNLGRLGGQQLVSAAMYPAASGPYSVAFGFATTPESSTLTLRTRTSDFTDDESSALLDDVVARLRDHQ